jgi:Tol biopolymer transport system component
MKKKHKPGENLTAFLFPVMLLFILSPLAAAQGKIAFVSYQTGHSEIDMMNADGTNQTRLTNYPGIDDSLTYSRDGSRIAFSSVLAGLLPSQIFAMNPEGTNLALIANNNLENYNPSWGGEPDSDGDGISDSADKCPTTVNPDQLDTDADGIGNNADPDDDNDGQPHANETAFGSNPLDAASKSPDNDSGNTLTSRKRLFN